MKYQYNSEIQYTNQNSRYNYGNSGEKQCYFWHGNFPRCQRTQSPAAGQNQRAPDVPRGQFWLRHIQNFVPQWRKNAASAEYCTLFITLNKQVNHVLLTCLVDRCEKTSLINLAVSFCKVDLAFIGKPNDPEHDVCSEPSLFTLSSGLSSTSWVIACLDKYDNRVLTAFRNQVPGCILKRISATFKFTRPVRLSE